MFYSRKQHRCSSGGGGGHEGPPYFSFIQIAPGLFCLGVQIQEDIFMINGAMTPVECMEKLKALLDGRIKLHDLFLAGGVAINESDLSQVDAIVLPGVPRISVPPFVASPKEKRRKRLLWL